MANILKAGSTIAAGSRIKSVDYSTSTTISADIELSDLNTITSSYTFSQIENAIKFCLNSVAPVFSESSTYAVDDFVIYEGLLYQCKTAISTPGAWDSSKWNIQKVFDNDGYVILNCGTSSTII